MKLAIELLLAVALYLENFSSEECSNLSELFLEVGYSYFGNFSWVSSSSISPKNSKTCGKFWNGKKHPEALKMIISYTMNE